MHVLCIAIPPTKKTFFGGYSKEWKTKFQQIVSFHISFDYRYPLKRKERKERTGHSPIITIREHIPSKNALLVSARIAH